MFLEDPTPILDQMEELLEKILRGRSHEAILDLEDWLFYEYGEDLLLKRGNWNEVTVEELLGRLRKDINNLRTAARSIAVAPRKEEDEEATVQHHNG